MPPVMKTIVIVDCYVFVVGGRGLTGTLVMSYSDKDN